MSIENKQSMVMNIHAYLDGELSLNDQMAFEHEMKQDHELRNEVCELRKIKQQSIEFYQRVPIPPMPDIEVEEPRSWMQYGSIAASLVFAFVLGFWVANPGDSQFNMDAVSPLRMADNHRVLLHLDSDQPQKVEALLRTANQLLESSGKQEPKLQVEIVANDHGIDLFEVSSQRQAEVLSLLQKYDNLRLIACKRAIERRAETGHPVHLINHVESDRPALDEIVDKMQQGWGYYKF